MKNEATLSSSTQLHADSLRRDDRVIRLKNVSKELDGARKVTALDGITLNVVRGELVAIVGPSGSGKSTPLNLIGTLDRPSSRTIQVDWYAIDCLRPLQNKCGAHTKNGSAPRKSST